jgi:hypothetical protein
MALSGHANGAKQCLLSGGKADVAYWGKADSRRTVLECLLVTDSVEKVSEKELWN